MAKCKALTGSAVKGLTWRNNICCDSLVIGTSTWEHGRRSRSIGGEGMRVQAKEGERRSPSCSDAPDVWVPGYSPCLKRLQLGALSSLRNRPEQSAVTVRVCFLWFLIACSHRRHVLSVSAV